jgi:hypothetical protein
LLWGHQATLLGWTCDDVFGATGNKNRRLSPRSASDGLVWALEGREVMALTDNAAVSRSSSGRLVLLPRRPAAADAYFA